MLTGATWAGLLVLNLLATPLVPWSVAAMAVVLWAMWQYLGGRWRPAGTSADRRRYRRANPVPPRLFAGALLSGLLGLGALIAGWIVMFQLVKMPGNSLPDFAKYPPLTVGLVLVMASVATSVAEEVGFRGYFLTRLEREVSAPVAILVAALVISPAHGMTQGFPWPTLLWYVVADVMFGTISYLTRSILPGLAIFFSLVWPNDAHRRLVWAVGASPVFWCEVALGLVLAVLAVLAFRRLSGLRPARAPQQAPPTPSAHQPMLVPW